jgi:DNA-directed RNA polymerase specialized sigma24 family protein
MSKASKSSRATSQTWQDTVGSRPCWRGPVPVAAWPRPAASAAAPSLRRGITVREADGQESFVPLTPSTTGVRCEGAALDRDAWRRLLGFLELTCPNGSGTAYERVRERLVRFFRAKGVTHAEELADATFDRVARKLSGEKVIDIRNPIGYVLGVARLIWLESVKLEVARRHRLDHYDVVHTDAAEARETEQNSAILERCLGELSAEERALLLDYYQGRGQSRIERRQALVRNLGLNPGLLRTRVHRLRAQLGRRVHEVLAAQKLAG